MATARIRRIVTMITGRALTEIEAAHPEAVLDYERTRLHEQVARYNRGLASHAALCERLRRREAALEREQATLRERVERRLAAGDRERAAQAALRLEGAEAEARETAVRLEEAEAGYRELVRAREVAIDAARERIAQLQRSIGELHVQQALADLSEMAAGLHGSIGVCEGTFDRVLERVEERREYAAGRVRVARDYVDLESARADEEDEAERAEEALRRFEARATPPEASPEPPR